MAGAYDYWSSSFLPIPTPAPGTLVIPWISIQTTSTTRAVITLGTPTQAPGSYAGSAASTGTFNDPDFTFTTSSGVHVRENLTPGAKYTVRARAWDNRAPPPCHSIARCPRAA